MVDSRFSRKISPAALLGNYKSAGENIENVKAISWAKTSQESFLHEPRLHARFDIDFLKARFRFCCPSHSLASRESLAPSALTQSTKGKSSLKKKKTFQDGPWHSIIAHFRYIKILTWLRGFRDKIAIFSQLHCLAIPRGNSIQKQTQTKYRKITRKPLSESRKTFNISNLSYWQPADQMLLNVVDQLDLDHNLFQYPASKRNQIYY